MAAKKKASAKKNKRENSGDLTKAKFPYTTKPGSLRKLLQLVPTKPKPVKFDKTFMNTWGFKDTNDMTILRVLKEVGLINDRNEPTELYSQFMSLKDGGKALGPEIKRAYAPIFQASHKPYDEDNQQLKNFFNINSGGGERSIEYQIQTFKALCEYASFEDEGTFNVGTNPNGPVTNIGNQQSGNLAQNPNININLHIHLPENKSRRDYETIIEDIGRYIFGRNVGEKNAP